MIDVIEDVVEGATVSEDENGFSAIRMFIVTGLKGPRADRILRALTTPRVPQYGEPYPNFPFMAVTSRNAVPLAGTDKATVTINYKLATSEQNSPDETAAPEWEFSSTVQQISTEKDSKNRQIFVDYFFPLNAIDPETGQKDDRAGSGTIRQFGTIIKQIPLIVARAKRKEKQDSLEKSKIFGGTVNKKKFLGDPARFWLCSDISSRTSDGGKTFDVVYEFIRNVSGGNGWDTDVIFIDPRTNKPVEIRPDQQGKALKRVQPYEETDFGALNIDFGRSSAPGGFGIFGAGKTAGGSLGAGQKTILSF